MEENSPVIFLMKVIERLEAELKSAKEIISLSDEEIKKLKKEIERLEKL